MIELDGRVGLVTGGAGGLGSAMSRALAAAGATVFVGYRNSREAAEALARDLAGKSHEAIACPVDDSAALAACAGTIAKRHGRLDVLVNNAGMTRFVPHGDLDGLDDDLFDQIMRTNVRGAFATIRAFRPLLEQGTDPVIINISSIAARTGMGSNVAYCASKAALDSVTRSLGRALAPVIRVISLAPGVVDTDFIKGLDPAWRQRQLAETPLRRFASAKEVGDAVVVIAGALTFTTGSVIAVDGGRPLGVS